MGRSEDFSYYFGVEAEQYSFYRVPRLLVKDERFKGLSSDAKLLYGLMLDRMSLSMKNGWLDEENRVYICYTIDSIMEDLGCAKEKCAKVLAELDSKKGIGLIEKKRRGLGKPDIIYVKNFATIDAANDTASEPRIEPEILDTADNSAEVRKSNFKSFENRTSGVSETELAEVRESNPNYTDINNTNMSYNPTPINFIHSPASGEGQTGMTDGTDDPSSYEEMIRENIAYDRLLQNLEEPDRKRYIELYKLICEIVCVKRKIIRINGADYPYEYVRSRFLQLNSSHLEYVISCLNKTATKITRMRLYLLTALFNAPTTMINGINQEVQHDMFGSGWEEKGIF